MALNFSHRPCSSHANGDCFDYGRNTGDSASVDILDVLPSDPFCMDINNTFTAITGWYGKDDMFAGFSFFWNNAMRSQEFPESSGYNNGSCNGAFISASNVGEALSLEDSRNGEIGGTSDCYSNENVHSAFGLCLYNLGVKDLLSVSMVCKSLHTIVCDDSLLWKHIHISQPLNEKITEEALLHITERAQGTMQCLKLVDCLRITDDCVKRVLNRNPQVVKLSVPGCTRITIDGVLSILRDLKSVGKLQVKHLEIGGLFGVSKDHFDELFDLLNIDNNFGQTIQKPHFYYRGDSSCVSCDDDRVLDIEVCPKCQNYRLVYDCPAEDCKGKEECRACSLCIQRCYQCGRCINDSEYEETFCLEFLCSDCSKPALKSTL